MSQDMHFEQSIMELEEIVRQLEKGELSLEESLKQFEKGISLARRCQDVLHKAEQKIEILTSAEPRSDEQLSDQ
ncbi:exodeoxyribonuclease VII small subunit [Legionella sp. PATHC035]|uniref:exodeoxyribonuclease VII small subunit n=1 Tax=Legionella sp. PATHC035 TaxID=2992040 RepID=UPI002243EDEA|nr:exodeoxyribonuclease VII small subunit [Legionella sp. PATHC035]MCW8409695.1 exodeoxyribonuclease VII small subunit [Legionella sp. PATHC035]